MDSTTMPEHHQEKQLGGPGNKQKLTQTRKNELIDEYLTSSKYTKVNSPWAVDTVKEWGLSIGSTHTIYSYTGKLKVPFSTIPAVFEKDNTQENYRSMLRSMHLMYSCVQREGMDAGFEGVLRKGAYAIAWIRANGRFHRVRVKDVWEKERLLVNCFDSAHRTFVDAEQLFPICSKFLRMRPRVVSLNLDGLERFDHCKDLKKIMENVTKWKHTNFHFKVTRHVRGKGTLDIYGLLYPLGQTKDLNSVIIQKLWEGLAPLTLPEESVGVQDWTVTHALEDGTVFVTFDCPVAEAFRDYQKSVKKTVDDALEIEGLASLTVFKPEKRNWADIYLVPDDNSSDFVRVKIIKPSRIPTLVRVRFIDIGKEEDCLFSSLLLAKKLHPYIALVPPWCVKAHIMNVASLDVTKFMRTIAVKKPFILRTVKSRVGPCPAEVQLFINQETVSGTREFVSVGNEVHALEIAKRTQEIYPEFSATTSDIAQVENIEMIGSTDWSEHPGEDAFMALEQNFRIYFVIKDTVSVSEFMIHPVGSETTLLAMSEEIKNHVNDPWVEKTMHMDIKQLHPRWFYSYYHKEKNCYTRVRYVEQRPFDRVKLLLIDFGEYVEVSLKEILPTIPVSVCRHGPQAAKVVNYVHNVPMQEQFTSLEKFKKMYEGKKCSALIKEFFFDTHEMATVKVKRLQLIWTD